MKKLLLTTVAGLSLVAAPLAATAAPFHSGPHSGFNGYNRGYNGYNRGNNGAGVALAAGVVGLFIGAALANANSHPVAYQQPYYADDQQDYYGQRCAWVAQPYTNGWGQTQYQQVWTCR